MILPLYLDVSLRSMDWPELRDRARALTSTSREDVLLLREVRRRTSRGTGFMDHDAALACLNALRTHIERWGVFEGPDKRSPRTPFWGWKNEELREERWVCHLFLETGPTDAERLLLEAEVRTIDIALRARGETP